jgi:hypothetical protein
MNETEAITSVIKALNGDGGWAVAVLTWVGTARIVFKLVSSRIEDLLSALATWLSANKDQASIDKVNSALSTSAWKVFAFLVDYIASIKLPLKL